MHHFIRRCFVLVLVLAFGFSFLLCCFVHTGGSQMTIYTRDSQITIPYNPDLYARDIEGLVSDWTTPTAYIFHNLMIHQPSEQLFGWLAVREPIGPPAWTQSLEARLNVVKAAQRSGLTDLRVGAGTQPYIPDFAMIAYDYGALNAYESSRFITGQRYSLETSLPSFLVFLPNIPGPIWYPELQSAELGPYFPNQYGYY